MWNDSREGEASRAHPPCRDRSAPAGIGGWLLVLCLLLLAWQPINLALVVANVVGALTVRGATLALVVFIRVLVAALGIAAGLALIRKKPAAPAFAAASLVASAATDLFVYSTPYFPHNRLPGETGLVLGASLAYHAIWITYLFRSKRVRNTYQD